MNQFETLVSELDAMAKALPANNDGDDQKIQAAGGAGGEGAGGTGGGEGEGQGAGDGEGEGGNGAEGNGAEGEPMAKSFKVKMADGTEVDALDAGEVLKALDERISVMGSGVDSVLKATVGLLKQQSEALTGQATMLKSLTEQVAKLSNQGGGRKTVLTVLERPDAGGTMAKGGAGAGAGAVDGKVEMDSGEFMAKAMDAMKAGKLTGLQVSVAEASINRNTPIPKDTVRIVLQHAGVKA